MKLYYSSTSPYARKVRIAALEKGLAERIELVLVNPWSDLSAILNCNPLGKVPVLVGEDSAAVYDSPVICEYLDTLRPDPRLIPASGEARWRVLRTQALADGILDAAVAIVLERRRPEAERSRSAQTRASEAICRGVQALATTFGAHGAALDLGQIAAGVALGYLEFRLPDLDTLTTQPQLREAWAALSTRASFAATAPD